MPEGLIDLDPAHRPGDGRDPQLRRRCRHRPELARQAAGNLAWGRDWAATGRVSTREDGIGVPGQRVPVRFETLACRAGLPPVRLHGAASLCKDAALDTRYRSALLDHARTSLTDVTCVLVFPGILKAAAEAAAAIVPRAREAR